MRLVGTPVMDAGRRESLLSAYIDVTGVRELYNELTTAGAELQQSLRKQPWGARAFVVRDSDGNLLCFAELDG